MKHQVIVVVGPTAVGKTKISIELAKHYHTDIISGDSIAVYRDLNIGSAKPSLEEQEGVKHHLIDILNPDEDYTVADFQKASRAIIEQSPLSIICGGTGLYIQSCLFQYEFEAPKRDVCFSKQYSSYTNQELYEFLQKLDPTIQPERIHPNNRKRVLRALEILQTTGNSINRYDRKEVPLYDYFIVYLNLDRDLLYERIHKRVDLMIESGLVEEARNLYERGLPLRGIGYQEFYPYFMGDVSLESVVEVIKKNTRHLAKRQETWFKNQMNSHFYKVNIQDIGQTISAIQEDIDRWLSK